jgi:cell division septal protein FtsQ
MPARRLGKHPNARIYMWRRVVFIVTVVITLSFIGKIVLGFFCAEYVSLELSGNIHYTDVQIYDVLGEKLENIVTDSEEQTAAYLRESLSYIKDAHVVKHVVKRILTITVTEREPFALLRFDDALKTSRSHISGVRDSGGAPSSAGSSFFLVDVEGHVLKNIEVGETGQWRSEGIPEELAILLVLSNEPPRIGTVVQRDEVKLGLEVLKTALLQEPALAAQIRIIDASDFQKIKLQIDALPAPVWLAGDTMESGLHHTALLLKQHKTRILELIGEIPSVRKPYIDVRYQDTLYLGGYTESK